MKIINAVKFIFPGISENERTARAVVSAFLVQLDPTVEELAAVPTMTKETAENVYYFFRLGTDEKRKITKS